MIRPVDAQETAAPSAAAVSVIIAAFNAATYIEEAIASALHQQAVDVEVIVVDDGSTDETAQTVRRAAERDNRVHYVHQQNRNQAAARNHGVRRSSAPLLAFLDADDIWESDKLRLQLAALSSERISVVFTAASHFASDRDCPLPIDLFGVYTGRLEARAFAEMLFQRNAIPLSSVLMTRSAFEEVGGFEEDQEFKGCEDWELWMHLASRGYDFFGMQQKLVRYRSHGAQTSQQTVRMATAALAVRQRYLAAVAVGADAKLLRRNMQRYRIDIALLRGQYGAAVRHTVRLLNVVHFGLTGIGSFAKQLWSIVQWRARGCSYTDDGA